MGGFEDFHALTGVRRVKDLMPMGYRIPFSNLQLTSSVTAKRFCSRNLITRLSKKSATTEMTEIQK